MTRVLTLAILASAAAFAMAPMSAWAQSPSQRECEAAGGTFTKSGGQVECVIVEEGKNPKFTETETTTGQGNISNKQEQDTECGGTGSNKCPPGQF
ncbi:hypothetical protein [Microvirga sp. VF16]|uniref:hypothetical protein n=1 Tax=Microvirga sp. VF16 TaxID=2807101 RepID=UPI00193E0939|nr:hypothetical protein [Microvirga sp. VF16]QRM31380.1 hypothetical protein JO965_10550 [Microvirga sp. VF16]